MALPFEHPVNNQPERKGVAGARESECGYLTLFSCAEKSLFFPRHLCPLSPSGAAAEQEQPTAELPL